MRLQFHLAYGESKVATDWEALKTDSRWIEQGAPLQLHTSFAAFAADLAARLEGGSLVRGVLATGDYVDQSGVITSRMVIVGLL